MTSNGHGPCSPFVLTSLFAWGHHFEEAVDHEFVGMSSYSRVSEELVRGAWVTQRQKGRIEKLTQPVWQSRKLHPGSFLHDMPCRQLSKSVSLPSSCEVYITLWRGSVNLLTFRNFLTVVSSWLSTLCASTSFAKGCQVPIRINC